MPVATEGSICAGMYEPEITRIKSRDIIDQVLMDHRKLESLFRAMRNRSADRAALLQQFAHLLVGHSDAEEKTFYPEVEKASGSNYESRVEHEHTQGLVALLALMEDRDIHGKSWEHKLTLLTSGIMAHIDDEEQTVHNKAREFMSNEAREQLGDSFVQMRDQLIAQNCGSIDNVRKLVAERATLMEKMKQKASQLL